MCKTQPVLHKKPKNDDEAVVDIAFICFTCKKHIIRNSEDHDHSKCDPYEEDNWYCPSCPVPDSDDEDEDDMCVAHPPYYCDGGCGKKVGEGHEDDCKRVCEDCDESDDEVQHDICCGCGKFKDTGGVCDCGCGHRELCDKCSNPS